MKYIFQFTIIAAISFVGELLGVLVPLPVPASIWGLLLLLVLLMTGLLQLRHVEKAADFLIQIMPLLFIGPTVSVLSLASGLADYIVAILVICIVSTVIVMAVTGLIAQAILRRREGQRDE